MAPLPTVREDEQEDDAETPRETTPLAPHPGNAPAAKFPSPRWRGALAISAVGIASVLGLGAVTGQFSCGDDCVQVEPSIDSLDSSPIKVEALVESISVPWAEFKKRFGKHYDAEEDVKRKAWFERRVAELDARNLEHGSRVFGLTPASDRAPGARAFPRGRAGRGRADAYMRAPRAADTNKLTAAARKRGVSFDAADRVDWRAVDGALTPVKNQGQCGSCWAFSAVQQVETAFFLNGGPPTVFSAQQATSCGGAKNGVFGCAGGDTTSAFEVMADSVGLAPAAFWPYAQGLIPKDGCLDAACTEDCDRDLDVLKHEGYYVGPSASVGAYSFATPPCDGACEDQDLGQLADIVRTTPVSVCVDASLWDDYTGGVLKASACSANYLDLDHCVQVVGFDSTGPEPYWIVRNSWSTAWGESGFIRLQFDANTCGLADEAVVVDVDGAVPQVVPDTDDDALGHF